MDTALIDQHIANVIQPVLEQHGATIVSRDYTEFYQVVTILFRGERIPVPASVIDRADPKALKFFLAHYDDLVGVIERLGRISAPFYSDISLSLDDQFGKGSRGDERTLAFYYVCSRLRAAGVRIWPND